MVNKKEVDNSRRTDDSVSDLVFNHALRMGFQSSTEELINTIPFLDTVAGEALSMLCGSKMILQFGAIGIRSPFAKVRVLLSSSTLQKLKSFSESNNFATKLITSNIFMLQQ